MIRGKSLIMVFSDLLTDPRAGAAELAPSAPSRQRGHPVFHILDEAEVHFPFEGLVEFEDVETPDRLTLDAQGMRDDYLQARRRSSRRRTATECSKAKHRLRGHGHERQLRQGAAWNTCCNDSGGFNVG